jgi:hypothetical protein
MEAEEVGEDPGQDGGGHVHQDETPTMIRVWNFTMWASGNEPVRQGLSTKARKRASNTWL